MFIKIYIKWGLCRIKFKNIYIKSYNLKRVYFKFKF